MAESPVGGELSGGVLPLLVEASETGESVTRISVEDDLDLDFSTALDKSLVRGEVTSGLLFLLLPLFILLTGIGSEPI